MIHTTTTGQLSLIDERCTLVKRSWIAKRFMEYCLLRVSEMLDRGEAIVPKFERFVIPPSPHHKLGVCLMATRIGLMNVLLAGKGSTAR